MVLGGCLILGNLEPQGKVYALQRTMLSTRIERHDPHPFSACWAARRKQPGLSYRSMLLERRSAITIRHVKRQPSRTIPKVHVPP